MCRCCWCGEHGRNAFFQEWLLARRNELVEEDRVSEIDRAPVALDQDSVGRVSRIDAMQVQAMALAQHRRLEAERRAIEAALQRIEGGEYGWCLVCGEAIAPARLEHNPAAPTCIVCARELEG
jgi:DnaK suppressor protein